VTAPTHDLPTRSYGCSFGCGNPYDFIFVSVVDGTTEFLCLPCMVRLASDMVAAVTEPDNPSLLAALAGAGQVDTAPMSNGNVKRRGKNAPVNTDDDDLISAYEDVITEDELPDAFR
jgi:hypothetical protein